MACQQQRVSIQLLSLLFMPPRPACLQDLAHALRSQLAGHPRFGAPRRSPHAFVVGHYAGEVAYSTDLLLDKNKASARISFSSFGRPLPPPSPRARARACPSCSLWLRLALHSRPVTHPPTTPTNPPTHHPH